MKITQSIYFYYAVSLVSLGIITYSVYYYLGGTKEMEVIPYEGVDYSVAGIEFKGRYNDPEIENIFNEVKGVVSTGLIQGTLSLIEYNDSDLKEGEVQYFIGIILQNRVTEIPGNYSVRRIQSRAILSVRLDVHPLVRPSKEEVEAKMYSLAGEKGFEIENFFLEKHFADDRMVIEGFVK